MIRGLYTATTGMINQQQRMDIIANNLANVNTTGFKKDNVVVESFKETLAIKIGDRGEAYTRRPIGRMTLGVKIGQVFTEHTQGAFEKTDNPLDLAIEGDGFFTVASVNAQGNEEIKYTRDGSFTLTSDKYLVTREGNYVLGENGRIQLPEGDIRISDEGNIYVNDNFVDKIQVANFEAYDRLERIGDNLYRVQGEIDTIPFNGQLSQGFLENSNVNAIKEMVEMITATRAYETSQKVIQTQDETLGKAVNEIGRL